MEVTLEILEYAVKLRDDLVKLEANEYFISLIKEEYFKDNVIRVAHLKADSRMQAEEMQRTLDNELVGAGVLMEYFKSIHARATIAEKQLKTVREQRGEL